MKKKPKKRKQPSRQQRLGLAQGRKLWEIGVAERRRVEGFDDGGTFSGLKEGPRAAWIAIGMHVLKLIQSTE